MREQTRGFFGIALYAPKHYENVGTLYRSCRSMGASIVFHIGKRYRTQKSDTGKTYRSVPFIEVDTMEDFLSVKPRDSLLVGCELTTRSHCISNYVHPERAIYLLGAEDFGLQENILRHCQQIIQIPSLTVESLNVAVAGSIIMWDRLYKSNRISASNKIT